VDSSRLLFFEPTFEKLPIAPLKIRLVDSSGRRVSGQRVTVGYYLPNMEYFGQIDGERNHAVLPTLTSDSHGEINCTLPCLMDDPIFITYKQDLSSYGFQINAEGDDYSVPWKIEFRPSRIPVMRKYPKQIVVTSAPCARLTVRIEDSFFKRHKIPGDLVPCGSEGDYSCYILDVRGKYSDNEFSRHGQEKQKGVLNWGLPAGTYDLILHVELRSGPTIADIVLHKGLSLKNNEDRNLVFD
jgi:hypothetical protein